MTTNETRDTLNRKFFSDPDWRLVEEMINEYIEPLRDVTTVDIKDRSSDSVMAEVAGRQVAYKKLSEFLRDSRILGNISNSKPVTFK